MIPTATTTIEVTLKISILHPKNALDQNSVKALINEGMDAIVDNVGEIITISDEPALSITVEVSRLLEDNKRQALSLYGTDDIPWGRDYGLRA